MHQLTSASHIHCYSVRCIAGKAGSKPHPSNQLHRDVGVLISGCADVETSADTSDPAQPGRPYGAMTQALVSVVRQHYRDYPTTPLTNRYPLACILLLTHLLAYSLAALFAHPLMRSFMCSSATDMHEAVRLESSFTKVRVNSMLQKYVARVKGSNPRKQGLTASLQN